MPDYDAFLLVSFGGPEGPDDVMPFLENVTRGRGIPRERLAAVAEHYYAVGGVSPINQQCRDLLAAIGKDFAAAGLDLPVYWGNRNWRPYLTATVADMAAAGVRRAVAFVTSAYGSYSSCRQYRDDIAAACAKVGAGAPRIDKLRHFFNHPGFIEAFAEHTAAAIDSLPAEPAAGCSPGLHGAQRAGDDGGVKRAPAGRPVRGATGRGVAPHRGAGPAARIRGAWPTRAAAGRRPSPGSAPMSATTLRTWPAPGHRRPSWSRSVSSPTTWRSSMTWTSRRPRPLSALGLRLARAATPGSHPRFVSMITELVRERAGRPVPAGSAWHSPATPRHLP